MTMLPVPPKRAKSGSSKGVSPKNKLAETLSNAKDGVLGGGNALSKVGGKIKSIDKKAEALKKGIKGKLGF